MTIKVKQYLHKSVIYCKNGNVFQPIIAIGRQFSTDNL